MTGSYIIYLLHAFDIQRQKFVNIQLFLLLFKIMMWQADV